MPWSSVSQTKVQGVAEQGEAGSCDWISKWIEELVEDDGEEKSGEMIREQESSTQTQDECRPRHQRWFQTLRSLQPWCSFAPAGVVLSVCQLEALMHPSASLVDVCCRLLFLCVLWIILGGSAHALKCCLRPGQTQGEPAQRKHQEVVTENKTNQYSRVSQTNSPDPYDPLSLALADSLLLCVLQEPLPDPSVPHIEALLFRLEAVVRTLSGADTGPEAALDEAGRGSVLTDKLKLLCSYLQQRAASLRTLVQVQGAFEASVKDVLQGLDSLWAQLEELHAGVTLTKQEGHGHRDLASAQTDAETLFAFLGHYKNRLHTCQAHLKDSTQLLQELTWSHTHISNKVNSSSESGWPELLLQSNIEQIDKVQESFICLEQQTSTFQAHLEGLGKGKREGHVGTLAHANGAHSGPVSPQTPLHVGAASPERSTSADADARTPLSLCEKSALQLSSTIGRLRKPGKKK